MARPDEESRLELSPRWEIVFPSRAGASAADPSHSPSEERTFAASRALGSSGNATVDTDVTMPDAAGFSKPPCAMREAIVEELAATGTAPTAVPAAAVAGVPLPAAGLSARAPVKATRIMAKAPTRGQAVPRIVGLRRPGYFDVAGAGTRESEWRLNGWVIIPSVYFCGLTARAEASHAEDRTLTSITRTDANSTGQVVPQLPGGKPGPPCNPVCRCRFTQLFAWGRRLTNPEHDTRFPNGRARYQTGTCGPAD